MVPLPYKEETPADRRIAFDFEALRVGIRGEVIYGSPVGSGAEA